MIRVVGALVLAATAAWGCRCPPSLSFAPCIRSGDVVFAGEVIRTAFADGSAAASLLSDDERRGLSDREDRIGGKYIRGTAILRVTEAFRGVDTGDEITVPIDSSSCGIFFSEREKYLFYGSREPDGSVSTGLCLGTVGLDQAQADLAYLRALKAGTAKGRIFGFVTRERDDAVLRAAASKPVPGVTVEISGAARKMLMTKADGWFEFDGLEPGEYQVRATLPGGVPTKTLTLGVGACSSQVFVESGK